MDTRSLRNYTDLARLRKQRSLLKHLRVNHADNFDEIQFTSLANKNNRIEVTLQSSLPGALIHYTMNGNKPSLNSSIYTSPVMVTKSCTLRAQLYDAKRKPAGREFQQAFTVHKGTGATVTLLHQPVERFNPGANALVNGVDGNSRFNNKQWIGFSGENMEALIDLDKIQTVRLVTLHLLNYHWQRIWAPVKLEIYVSEDAHHFSLMYAQDKFDSNGINTVNATIKPVKAKYVKVIAINRGIIPEGEYGGGGKALLLIDEIIIN